MEELVREAILGLLLRLLRAVALLIVFASLRRPAPVRAVVAPPVATQPAVPVSRHDRLMQRSAADVESAIRLKLGWP